MDDGLPELLGFDLVRVLKSHPPLRSTRVIMLTGLLSESQRAARFAGADGFVTKPCGEAALVNEIRRVLRPQPNTRNRPS